MTTIRRAWAACTIALTAVLAGCSATVSLDPAPDANNPACAGVMTGLLSLSGGTLDGQSRVWTDAQATASWGSPTAVIMRCGVTPPGPTTLKCITLGGIDWIVDETQAPNFRITSFGRTPAVQVYLNSEKVDSNEVLDTLGRLVSQHTTKSGQCTDPETAPSA